MGACHPAQKPSDTSEGEVSGVFSAFQSPYLRISLSLSWGKSFEAPGFSV